MSYGAEIRVAVKLEQLKLLEDRITLLQGRFTKLNAAMANLGKFAQPKLNIDTLGAERKVAVLRKQIQSLNTGTTTVKVRTIFENSGSSGSSRGGSGAAAAAAAGAFGGFSASGSAAAMRKISESMGSSRGSGGSSSLAAMTRELKDLADGLRTDLLPAERELQLRQKAINDAYTKSLSTIRAVTAAIGGNEGAIAELNQQLAAAKAKLASLNGVPSTFADELSADITAATARLKELNSELKLNQNRLLSANFKADGFNQLGNNLPSPAVVSGQARLEEARKRLPRGAGVVGNALGAATTLVGTYAGVSGLQQLGQSAINRTTADLGLKANTEQLGEYKQATKAVEEQVKLLGLSQTEATKNFTTAYAALRPLGLQLETVNQLQQGFVATARASGRSVEEATSSWRQYVQAIGKGRLNGDELVSISENAPQLYQQLAKELKVNVGALKDLGEEGKITADVLVKAGLALRDGSLTKLEKILQGPQQQLKNLSNEFENLGVALGKVFGPALGQELKGFVDGVKGVTQWVSKLTPAQGKLVVESVKLAAQLFLVSKAIQAIQGAGAVVSFLRTLAATQVAVGTSAGGATVLVNGLALALGRLAAIGVVTVGVKYVIDQVGEIRAGGKRIGASEAAGSAKALQAQYSGLTQSEATKKLKEAQANLANDRRLLSTSRLQQQADELQRLPGEVGRPTDNQKLIELEARIKTNEARIRYLQGNSFPATKPDPAAARQAEIDALLKGVPVPGTDPKDTKKATDDARKAAEALAADRAQLDKALATTAINLDNTVFQNRQNQLQQQYELERQLQQKTSDNWSLGFTGAGRDQAGLINQLNSNLQGYGDQIQALQSQIAAAEQKLKNAKAGVGVAQIGAVGAATTAAATSRVSASGGFTTQQLSAATSAASKFTGVANMCSESVKAFYQSLGISLPGVTAWADTVRKAGTVMRDWSKLKPGDIVATGRPGDTPHVGVYTGGNNVFHQSGKRGLKAGNYPDLDYFKGGYFVRPNAGVAAAGMPAVPGAAGNSSPLAGADSVAAAVGDVSTAQAELQGLNDQLKQLQAGLGGLKQADVTSFILQSTDAFRSQAAELKNGTAQLELRSMLEAKGMSNGYIEAEVQKLAVSQDLAQRLETLKAALDNTLISQDAYTAGTVALKDAANAAATALDAQGAAADKADRLLKQQQEIRDLYNGIGNEITNGLVNGLVMAASATDRLGESMQNLAGDILAAIGKALILSAITGALNGMAGDDGVGFFSMLAGKFGKRAAGGPVNAGAPYLVGEEGPELILPQRSGYVLNARETEDALADSRRALSGRGAESETSAFNENKEMLSAVTNNIATRVAEASQSNRTPVQVEYRGPQLTFNGDDYLPKDAAVAIIEEASQRGARLGHRRTLAELKNNPGARRTIGI